MQTQQTAALELRLDNWVRWTWGGGDHRERCGSAEGRYIEPRPDAERVAAQSRPVVDVVDAEAVDVALRTLPAAERWLLDQWYRTRAPLWLFCRALRLPARSLDSRRFRALEALRLALGVDVRPVLRHYRPQMIVPGSAVTAA